MFSFPIQANSFEQFGYIFDSISSFGDSTSNHSIVCSANNKNSNLLATAKNKIIKTAAMTMMMTPIAIKHHLGSAISN